MRAREKDKPRAAGLGMKPFGAVLAALLRARACCAKRIFWILIGETFTNSVPQNVADSTASLVPFVGAETHRMFAADEEISNSVKHCGL